MPIAHVLVISGRQGSDCDHKRFIADPVDKAKSVVLINEGLSESERLFSSFSQGRSLPLADRGHCTVQPCDHFADAARYRTSSKLKVELEEIQFSLVWPYAHRSSRGIKSETGIYMKISLIDS
jgi:hypothetical protein